MLLRAFALIGVVLACVLVAPGAYASEKTGLEVASGCQLPQVPSAGVSGGSIYISPGIYRETCLLGPTYAGAIDLALAIIYCVFSTTSCET